MNTTIGEMRIWDDLVTVVVRRPGYRDNGRIAVMLESPEWGDYGCVSVNVHDIPLDRNEFIVSNDGYTEKEVSKLLALGFKDTGRRASYGFVQDRPILEVPHFSKLHDVPDLPLFYKAEPERMREVASYVFRIETFQWMYHSRGTAREAIVALQGVRPGFIGGVGELDPDHVRVILDDCGRADDRVDLCWGGPPLTVEQFRDWYKRVS